MGKNYTILKKIGAQHRASLHEKKNRMHRHMIFRSYCCYYGHYYYRMTTVVNDSSYSTWYNDVGIPCRVATVVITVVMR